MSRYDDAAEFIRRLLRGFQAPPASSADDFAYHLGDEVPRAVPPRGAADEAAAAADDLGRGVPVGAPYRDTPGDIDPIIGEPEYAIDWGGPDARFRQRTQAAEQAAQDMAEAAAAQARYRESTTPAPNPWTPAAAVGGAGAAGAAAGMAVRSLFDDEPAVTSGGTAELAAETTPLTIAPEPEVTAPASKRAAAAQADAAPARPKAPQKNRNLRGDAFYSQPGVFDTDRRHRDLVAAGMTPEEAAAKMAKDYFADYDARVQARADAAMQPKQGPVYGPESVVYDADGRPHLRAERQVVLRPGEKIDPITGRATNMSDREREDQARARLRAWVNEEPGSKRQGQYNPAGWDQWYQTIVDRQHQDYLADVEKYGSAEGKGWRDRLTPAQAKARAERDAAESARFRQRVAARELLKSDPRVIARQAARQAEMDRRARNRQLMTQHPFITLGDPDINDWQRFVLAQGMSPEGARVTDPNAVAATHNEQMTRLAELFARNPAIMGGAGGGLDEQLKQKRRDEAKQDFDNYWAKTHADRMFSRGKPYTPEDRNRVVNYLHNQYGLSIEEAQAIADSQGTPVAAAPPAAAAPSATPGRAAVAAPHPMNGLPPVGR